MKDFPVESKWRNMLDSGDGVCKYLNRESRLCSIYSERPPICRYDWVYENLYKGRMTLSEYDLMISKFCAQFRANRINKINEEERALKQDEGLGED